MTPVAAAFSFTCCCCCCCCCCGVVLLLLTTVPLADASCNAAQAAGCRKAAGSGELDSFVGGGECMVKAYVQYTHVCTVTNYLPSVDFCCCAQGAAVLCCRYHQQWYHFRCALPDDDVTAVGSLDALAGAPWEIILPAVLCPLMGLSLCLLCCCHRPAQRACCAPRGDHGAPKHPDLQDEGSGCCCGAGYDRGADGTCNCCYRGSDVTLQCPHAPCSPNEESPLSSAPRPFPHPPSSPRPLADYTHIQNAAMYRQSTNQAPPPCYLVAARGRDYHVIDTRRPEPSAPALDVNKVDSYGVMHTNRHDVTAAANDWRSCTRSTACSCPMYCHVHAPKHVTDANQSAAASSQHTSYTNQLDASVGMCVVCSGAPPPAYTSVASQHRQSS